MCLSTTSLLATEKDSQLPSIEKIKLSSSPSKLSVPESFKSEIEGQLKQKLEAALADLESFLGETHILPTTETTTKKPKSTKTEKANDEANEKRKRADSLSSSPSTPKLIRTAALPGMTPNLFADIQSSTKKRKSSESDGSGSSQEETAEKDSGSSPEEARSPITSPRLRTTSAPSDEDHQDDHSITVVPFKDTFPKTIKDNIDKKNKNHYPDVKGKATVEIIAETDREIEVEVSDPRLTRKIRFTMPSLMSLLDSKQTYGLDLKRVDVRENILRENDLNFGAADVSGDILNYMKFKEKMKYIQAIWLQLATFQKDRSKTPELSADSKEAKEKKKTKISKRQKLKVKKFRTIFNDIKKNFEEGTWTPEHTDEILETRLQTIMSKLPGIQMSSLKQLPSKTEAEIMLNYKFGEQTTLPS